MTPKKLLRGFVVSLGLSLSCARPSAPPPAEAGAPETPASAVSPAPAHALPTDAVPAAPVERAKDGAEKEQLVSAAVSLGPGDNGRTVELRAGQALELLLPTNPTTGYDWQATTADFGQPVTELLPPKSDAEGAGATRRFFWSSIPPGEHTVELFYRREKHKPPVQTYRVELKVPRK